MNNLKAERTLTAERLQAIIDGCEKLPHGPWFHGPDEGRNGTAGLAQVDNGAEMWPVIAEWHEAEHIARLDPETVKAMALELQHLRSQSLSTQQPMGEVVAWSDVRDFIIHRAEQLKGSIPRQVFWALADDMSNKLRGVSALHPNQESGE